MLSQRVSILSVTFGYDVFLSAFWKKWTRNQVLVGEIPLLPSLTLRVLHLSWPPSFSLSFFLLCIWVQRGFCQVCLCIICILALNHVISRIPLCAAQCTPLPSKWISSCGVGHAVFWACPSNADACNLQGLQRAEPNLPIPLNLLREISENGAVP